MTFAAWVLALAVPAGAFVPSSRLSQDVSPSAVAARCAEATRWARSQVDVIAKDIPASARTFANTPEALEEALDELNDRTAFDAFQKDVAVSSATRDAGQACQTAVAKFGVEVFSREDLYAAVSSYARLGERLGGEPKRLLEKELLDFKRSGAGLSPEKRHSVMTIRERLVELEQEFQRNVAESREALHLSLSDLDGLPDAYIARLPREGSLYVVSVDYPDYFPFMENAADPKARQRLQILFDNRAALKNEALLEEALRLRGEAAALLGYESHAAFVLDDRMAKTPAAVERFLKSLRSRLKPKASAELALLLELKRQTEGPKSDGVLHAWDFRYYDNQLKKSRYHVDMEKAREYFPLDVVVEGMLAVYQRLLGLRFKPVADAEAWHPDVRLYEVSAAAGGPALGWFYLDLYPRPGKYRHAAAFTLVQGRRLPDGTYQRPVSAIVANFAKPTPDRPTLLSHGEGGEVETFFHEFGHVMHQLLTRARYERFSGTSVAQDFVEAPSQMLENWVWDPGVLKSLSGHYKDHSKKLPPDLLMSLIAAKRVDTGLRHLRQAFFATVDQRYHERPIDSPNRVYRDLMQAVSLIPMTPGTHPEAGFEHLMSGYDASYYGYLWSKAYAQDLFSRFEESGLQNPAIGRLYREQILEPGSSRDEIDSLRAFLGREPNDKAFLRSLGIP